MGYNSKIRRKRHEGTTTHSISHTIFLPSFLLQVRKKRTPETQLPQTIDSKEFFLDMKYLLKDQEYMDCVLIVQEEPPAPAVATILSEDDEDGSLPTPPCNTKTTHIRAHKVVLTARSEYFQALFSHNTFREGTESTVTVDAAYGTLHVQTVLEYMYTNNIQQLLRKQQHSTNDLLLILKLADLWLLPHCKLQVEHELARHHISLRTLPRLYLVAGSPKLRDACLRFIFQNHHHTLTQLVYNNAEFQAVLTEYPELCVPLLQAAADRMESAPPPASKKQRTSTTRSPMDAPSSSSIV